MNLNTRFVCDISDVNPAFLHVVREHLVSKPLCYSVPIFCNILYIKINIFNFLVSIPMTPIVIVLLYFHFPVLCSAVFFKHSVETSYPSLSKPVWFKHSQVMQFLLRLTDFRSMHPTLAHISRWVWGGDSESFSFRLKKNRWNRAGSKLLIFYVLHMKFLNLALKLPCVQGQFTLGGKKRPKFVQTLQTLLQTLLRRSTLYDDNQTWQMYNRNAIISSYDFKLGITENKN